MKERIAGIVEGPFPKKYTAVMKNKATGRTRKIHFGDRRYEQFKDRTQLALYANKNHNDRRRLRNYYSRHSGVKTRKAGLAKERQKAQLSGLYSAKLLSHLYLW